MKTETNSSIIEEVSDASLVNASREGDRQAFGQIVTRYQRLLCSLAYSALGSLSESEDVAQEAFVEAWRKLESLREPEKLKAWLCGILRFKVSRYRRKEARQPVHRAAELTETDVLESNEEAIDAVAMKEEEQAILWRALESVPETYRETMILYYREHRSVEHVACELDLTEQAVRQRLSRGRKLLQEKMMTFVEGALVKSTPGPIFTASVLAALATAAPPAKAAAYGATAAKVGSTFKWVTIASVMATVSGFVSSFYGMRASLDQARTQRERQAVIKTTATFLGTAILLVVALLGLRQVALTAESNAWSLAMLSQVLVIGFVVVYVAMTGRMLKRMRALRTAERVRRPELFESLDDQLDSGKREYKSGFRLLGIPFIHAKFAMAEENDEPAVGWIAAGDRAYGLLFAWGGIAVAPISVGIVSCGLVTAGAVGFGIVGMGMVGLGLLGIGAVAVGYKAYASLSAMGWESAFSQGFSLAKEAALGPIAYAEHVNTQMAASIANLTTADQTYGLILAGLAALVIIPGVWYARVVRRRMRKPVLD